MKMLVYTLRKNQRTLILITIHPLPRVKALSQLANVYIKKKKIKRPVFRVKFEILLLSRHPSLVWSLTAGAKKKNSCSFNNKMTKKLFILSSFHAFARVAYIMTTNKRRARV